MLIDFHFSDAEFTLKAVLFLMHKENLNLSAPEVLMVITLPPVMNLNRLFLLQKKLKNISKHKHVLMLL